jgi:predicted nucleic acid-binding protein
MIVFDSSTLILLARIDMLEMFIANFHGRVLIPEKVESEVCEGGREEMPLIVSLIEGEKINVLKVRDMSYASKLMKDFNIDNGEAEAISLAIAENAKLIATDDRNAIRACKFLKIDFITAIAILIRACEKSRIEMDEAIIKLTKLASIGRYNKSIIEDAEKLIKGGL